MGIHSDEAAISESGSEKGCRLSLGAGFVLTFLALAIAVGVGIIVHFAGKGTKFECVCNYPAGDAASALKQCGDLASEGNKQICDACPGSGKPPSTESPTKPPTIDYRLPSSLEPILYSLEMKPYIYSGNPADFSFEGKSNVRMLCRESTTKVTLHAHLLTIDSNSIKFTAEEGTAPSITRQEEDSVRQFLTFHLDGALEPGKYYNLEMSYTGPIEPDLSGIYESHFYRGSTPLYTVATLLEPTGAREILPCFDEPAIKAMFDVTLVRKKHIVALSNMDSVSSVERLDDFVADTFNTTVKMSTYLLAFVFGEYASKETFTRSGVKYRVWSRPEDINQTDYALDMGSQVLQFYEDYFAVPYPLPKEDSIITPQHAAEAMENWGLITYRADAILYDAATSSALDKQWVALVNAHELGHQWYGNLVSPAWWDDLWLNEGFANFVMYIAIDHVHSDWKIWEVFPVNYRGIYIAFDADGLVNSHPLYAPVFNPGEILQIFDMVSYAKGAAILRMLQHFLGPDTFRRGLTRYLTDRSFAAATHNDLWSALSEQAKEEKKTVTDVAAIMNTWTLQMNFPLVTVTRISDTVIHLDQSRYLRDPDAVDPGTFHSTYGYKWEIPFTFTTSTELNFNKTDNDVIWMSKTGNTVSHTSSDLPPLGGPGWILGNVLELGFYRVNYEESNWLMLIQQLKSEHTVIPLVNRAQIIDDAWNLVKSGQLKVDYALETAVYLNKEREFVPWKVASKELGIVETMLQRTDIYRSFANMVKEKVKETYGTWAYSFENSKHTESLARGHIVEMACKHDIEDCVTEASNQFAAWMQNPQTYSIAPDIRIAVYCSAIKSGGEAQWNFAYDQYKKTELASEKLKLIEALGCTQDPWLLSRYLDWSLDPGAIRPEDTVFALRYIAENPVGTPLYWDFIGNNWNRVLAAVAGYFFDFSDLIHSSAASFNTKYQVEQLGHFLATHPNQATGVRAFQQVLEKARSNVKWMERNYDAIKKWLSDHGY